VATKLPDPQIWRNGVYQASYTTIAAALSVALPGDTIMLEKSATFDPTANGFIITENLNFGVLNGGTATINGINTASTGSMFTINNGVTVTMSNIEFVNAKNSAINNYGTLTLTKCTFGNNKAVTGASGGAIWNVGSVTKLTVNECTFLNNMATGGSGGAIYNYEGFMTVTDSDFTSNSALQGGAIYNIGSNPCTVTGSNFTSNTATDGGGAIFNAQTTNVKPLTITNSNFNGNSATNAGGAIENANTAILNVNNSNFTGNKATAINGFGGGAIYNGDGSSLTPTSCIFVNDASPFGGAIENYYGTAVLQYNQITGNTGIRGTIYNQGGSMYASPNWWGTNAGPAPGVIDGTGVAVTNWLVLKLSANPTTIGNYAHSNIIADLRYDNYGNYVSGGFVPNGIPVTFNTNLGTISPQAYTVNGVATATLTSGVPTGLATVSAYLDNQPSLYTSVTIKAIPPKVLKTSPTNKKTGFSKTGTIYIKFSENIKSSTYYKNIKVKNLSTGKYVSISKSISGTDLKIKTSSTRRGHNWYEVIIPKAAIKDMSNNELAATYTFKFKTKK